MEGLYDLHNYTQVYHSDGNTVSVSYSNENEGDCRKMDVDSINVYLDEGNNSNARCTDENDGYSGAGEYITTESFRYRQFYWLVVV